MDEIVIYLKENFTLSILISAFILFFAILTFRINSRKFKFDKTDYENKKAKFSIYLENSYRFNYKDENEKYLLFNIRVNNFSTIKISFLAKLKIVYYISENKKTIIELENNPEYFHSEYHKNLTKFPKEIRIEDREIKSGWIVFKFPKNLIGKKIDFYEILIIDTFGNEAKVSCNFLREIDYEN